MLDLSALLDILTKASKRVDLNGLERSAYRGRKICCLTMSCQTCRPMSDAVGWDAAHSSHASPVEPCLGNPRASTSPFRKAEAAEAATTGTSTVSRAWNRLGPTWRSEGLKSSCHLLLLRREHLGRTQERGTLLSGLVGRTVLFHLSTSGGLIQSDQQGNMLVGIIDDRWSK